MNFKKYTIQECCEILDNLRVPMNAEERFDIKGEYPYYGANGVQGYISKYIFDDDLILVAEDGGNFEQFSTRPIAYRVSGKCWVNNHAHVLKAKENFSQSFIFYSLEHKNILYFIAGGTRSKLTKSELKLINIFHPEKNEANKIAEIIENADESIIETEKLIAKNKRIKKGLLQELLTKGIDEDGKIRNEKTHQFKNSQIGRIPSEWNECAFSELNHYLTSGSRNWSSYYSAEGALFVRITNLTREHINFRFEDLQRVNLKSNDEGTRTKLSEGDLLISITADLGIIGVVPSDLEESYINQHIALFRIFDRTEINPRFIGHYLSSDFGQKQFTQLNDGGAKAGLNLSTILKIKFPKLSIQEQDAIALILDNADKLIKEYETNLQKLRSVKIGLMQDLLSGKVRLKI